MGPCDTLHILLENEHLQPASSNWYFDPVAVDAVGSELLGHDPKTIEYLQLAHGRLGSMDDIEIFGSSPVR